MEQDEKIKEAQEILNWAITHLSGNVTCKVIDYKHENYRVQFFTKENKLIMPVQIPEEWIEDSNLKENFIHDKLKTLLRKCLCIWLLNPIYPYAVAFAGPALMPKPGSDKSMRVRKRIRRFRLTVISMVT